MYVYDFIKIFLANSATRLVVKYGFHLLKNHKSKLGDEVWELYERVFIAALECHQNDKEGKTYDVASFCLQSLRAKFGNSSTRYLRLVMMEKESKGLYEDALVNAQKILKQDPSNMHAWKRKIAIYKAAKDEEKAIEELAKYLNIYPSDESGWQELTQLYISQQKFELAKFCIEELILLVPENYLYHLQYAEVLYTAGSKPDFETARKYFAQSLELKPDDNLRALYGLVMCLRAQGSPKDKDIALYQSTVEKILNLYKKQSPSHPLLSLIERTLL